ncbi:MAG: cation transporter [Proteobacteria bacterium]|nr:cation transporter [Pseudomonadota bacterium]
MAGCDCEIEIKDKSERKVLYILLFINALMFAVELVFGWLAQSSGLIADSLDNLADAMVYGLALYAVGKSVAHKARSAYLNGGLQLILGTCALIDVGRRSIVGSDPEPVMMIAVSLAALAANVVCLAILTKHREGGVHMRATWICSRNDVIANLGVIIAGALVAFTASRLPDLIIGCIISIVVTRGGFQILDEAKKASPK